MCRVFKSSDVEEGGAYPVQGHADATDGSEHNLSVQMLDQVAV